MALSKDISRGRRPQLQLSLPNRIRLSPNLSFSSQYVNGDWRLKLTTKTNTCVLRVVLTRFHKRKQSDMFQFFISLTDFAISDSGWLAYCLLPKKRRCRGRMGDSLPVLFFSVQFSAQRFVLSHKNSAKQLRFTLVILLRYTDTPTRKLTHSMYSHNLVNNSFLLILFPFCRTEHYRR